MATIKLMLFLPVIIICLSGDVAAELNLLMDFYNPQDMLSVGLYGENLNYSAGVTLMPDSLSYKNDAQSFGKDCYYSYQVVLNAQKITSGVKTDSGSFKWTTNANVGVDTPPQMTVTYNNTVDDGTLYSYETNEDYKIEQTMHAFNALSVQQGTITQHFMASSGIGNTKESSLTHQIKGFQDVINVTHLVGDPKPADIDLNANGDTDSKWQYYFNSNPAEYSFGQAIIGVMRPYDKNNLTMKGEAAGFPTQVLPYPGINISYQLNNSRYGGDIYNETFRRLKYEINDSINQSKGIYSEPSLPQPVPIYSFDSKDLTNPENIDITGKSAKDEIFYRMAVQFKVKV